MERRIYHGGKQIVKAPVFGAGRAYNDFGLGFYCTESPDAAAEWASAHGTNGFVSAYSIDYSGLSIINLCSRQYTPLHWLSLLMSFREFDMSSRTSHRAREYINKNFSVDYQGSDCIAGWRADDHCFALAQDFLDGRLAYQDLRQALSSDGKNRQFVLKSNRAFERISFAGYRPVLSSDFGPAAYSRGLRMIRSCSMPDALNHAGSGALFVADLIEQEVSPYDPRL